MFRKMFRGRVRRFDQLAIFEVELEQTDKGWVELDGRADNSSPLQVPQLVESLNQMNNPNLLLRVHFRCKGSIDPGVRGRVPEEGYPPDREDERTLHSVEIVPYCEGESYVSSQAKRVEPNLAQLVFDTFFEQIQNVEVEVQLE